MFDVGGQESESGSDGVNGEISLAPTLLALPLCRDPITSTIRRAEFQRYEIDALAKEKGETSKTLDRWRPTPCAGRRNAGIIIL
jgi:hypothetical protein